MSVMKTHCPHCNEFFCLPSEYDLHLKYCSKNPSKSIGSKPILCREDDGPSPGAFIAGAIVGSMLGGSHDDESPGSSCGGGDSGGGGASESYGDSGGGGDD